MIFAFYTINPLTIAGDFFAWLTGGNSGCGRGDRMGEQCWFDDNWHGNGSW